MVPSNGVCLVESLALTDTIENDLPSRSFLPAWLPSRRLEPETRSVRAQAMAPSLAVAMTHVAMVRSMCWAVLDDRLDAMGEMRLMTD